MIIKILSEHQAYVHHVYNVFPNHNFDVSVRYLAVCNCGWQGIKVVNMKDAEKMVNMHLKRKLKYL